MGTIRAAHPVNRLRAAILTDEALQAELAPLTDIGAFIDSISEHAKRLGLAIERSAFATGMARASERQSLSQLPGLVLAEAPPRHWLPIDIKMQNGHAMVEWLHFAGAPLTESFFEESIRRSQSLPFNLLMRCATPLSAIERFADTPPPDGLIFHMSRCGSTLVAQMLAAVPTNIVISEPPLLDILIQMVGHGAAQRSAIRGTVAALTRNRAGSGCKRFVKLDSWHALALPMLREVFPETPWVFLYRDPIEVLASQHRKQGMHVRPGVIDLSAFGVSGAKDVEPGHYAAWILDQIGAAGLKSSGGEDSLLINYDQLPEALTTRILPHFKVKPSPREIDQIEAASFRYSKAPRELFAGDSEAKRKEASATLRASADRGLTATYAKLEERRTVMEIASSAGA